MNRNRFVKASSIALGAGCVALTGAAQAEDQTSVLEDQPTRLISFETANTYDKGTLELSVGLSQTYSNDGGGTGNQLYFGGAAYAVSDRVTLGFDLSSYRDPVLDPINGLFPDIRMETAALWGKFGLVESGNWKVAAQASVENIFSLESPLWGGVRTSEWIGSLKAPISYSVSPSLQFHFTPAVSVFPDSVGGAEFYGTIVSLGAGVSYQPNERLSFFGAIDMPISGNNTITNTGTYDKVAVWTAGARYNVTPKAALEAYVTNGVGMTPATSILTHWPDGDRVLGGLRLVYTPDASRPESYRGVPNPVT
ncbi:hypothetical protein [uncultured Shimia sp.]|uniref:hypothetical protein n=1 Tax=uncultured Shimia sp. TaxID=573152 RepID=UPI00260823E3|nr:hypothetical protein [uncultured Shimia sp.]